MLWRAWSRRRGARACAAIALAAASLAVWLATAGGGPARASGGEPLLPYLIAEPPTGPELQIHSENGANHLLVRFNGYIHNAGKGALDMEGEREAPKLSAQGQLELKAWELTHGSMSESLRHELANPPMKVRQNVFTTSAEETNIERPHDEVPSSAVMEYANADGHNHWHLQHVAKYSLWNASKTAPAAPSQKVGFCLTDSEHPDSFGPSQAVYEEAVRGDFCERYKPGATHLREGISRGWKDRYLKELAFQWVDASEVAPGQYWLREDVNPDGAIKEEGTGFRFAYASKPTVIPGYTARPQTLEAKGLPLRIKLEAQTWEGPEPHEKPSGKIKYQLVSAPAHGTLEAVSGNEVIYKPTGGYSGADSFKFSARDEKSEFPRTAPTATVSITDTLPSVAISGSQPQLVEGTGITLTASATNDNGPIEWSTSAGTLSSKEGESVVFTAPHSTGPVTITASLHDDPEVSAKTTIEVVAPAPVGGSPEPPPQTGSSGNGSSTSGSSSTGSSGVLGTNSAAPAPRVQRPRVMLFNRELVMDTSSTVPGRIRLTAYLGRHRLGTCVSLTPGSQTFSCRLHLAPSISTRARISVVASLRAGSLLLTNALSARRIPEMRMVPVGLHARGATAGGGVFWCSPGTLHEMLETGSQ